MGFKFPAFLRKRSDVEFAHSANADRLRVPIEEFLCAVVQEEALFVSDESSVWDFDCSIDDGAVLMARIECHYGIAVSRRMLDLPLWQLVERLELERSGGGSVECGRS